MTKKSHSMVSELRSMDLNLLVALRALLDERNVSRAAEKSGLSQPGMSRALQRLRSMFNDPLLVKSEQGGYEPTPRAEAIDFALRQILFDIQNIIAPPTFDPALAKGDFRILALDYELVVLLPKIVARIRNEAPGLNVWTIAPKMMNTQEGIDFSPLIRGEIQLILTAFTYTHSGIYRQKLLEETNICISSVNHPDAGSQPFPLEKLKNLDHLWVDIIGPDPGAIDETLATHGLSRDIKLSVPSFLLAGYTVATTDLIAIMPRRVMQPFADAGLISIMEPPIGLPAFTIYQYWHERYNKDPLHVWFRKLVLDVARTLD